jgi:hypothetical protein
MMYRPCQEPIYCGIAETADVLRISEARAKPHGALNEAKWTSQTACVEHPLRDLRRSVRPKRLDEINPVLPRSHSEGTAAEAAPQPQCE